MHLRKPQRGHRARLCTRVARSWRRVAHRRQQRRREARAHGAVDVIEAHARHRLPALPRRAL
jgi:hypothetical protein